MKTLKKINFAILAVVLGLGLVFTQSAFKAAPVKKTGHAYWTFDSNNISDARNYTKYTYVPGFDPETDLECEAGEALPCVLDVDGDIDQPLELNSYLTSGMFTSDEAVTASTEFKKGS